MLPFPGAEGVTAGLSALLGKATDSMDTDDNVDELRDRAFFLAQVFVDNHAGLSTLKAAGQEAGITNMLNRFTDCLIAIDAFSDTHRVRSRVSRIITSGGDADDFSKLQASLQALIDDVTLVLTSDTRSMVGKMMVVSGARVEDHLWRYKPHVVRTCALDGVHETGILCQGARLCRSGTTSACSGLSPVCLIAGVPCEVAESHECHACRGTTVLALILLITRVDAH